MWFQVEQPEVFLGQCAELCGAEHYNMPIRLNVMPDQEFAAWLDAEAVAVAAAQEVDLEEEAAQLEGNVGTGQALYTGLGCQACHSLDGTAGVGPTYAGISGRAGTMVEGLSAEDYIRESILRPCDFLVESYTCVMPQNYAEQLSPQDLADLVAFILSY
jgi:cytochrome c oxidase subunit 2